MINCQNSSKRLKVEAKELECTFQKLGISEDMPKLEFSIFETKKLVKYIKVFIPQITDRKYDEIEGRYETLREVILAVTCFSGDVRNLEPVWITYKILRNEKMIQENVNTQQIS